MTSPGFWHSGLVHSKVRCEFRFVELEQLGFHKIRFGVDKENPQSNAFWKKNGFIAVDESEYILMELDL